MVSKDGNIVSKYCNMVNIRAKMVIKEGNMVGKHGNRRANTVEKGNNTVWGILPYDQHKGQYCQKILQYG